MPVDTYNTRSTSGYVKWFAILITTAIYISDVKAQNKPNTGNRTTFNQKYTRSTQRKSVAKASRNSTRNTYYSNQQDLRRYRRHITFQQPRVANFSSRAGRALTVSRTYTTSQMEAKKSFLGRTINRPGGTRRYQPGSSRPTYAANKKQARPTPKDRYSPSRWNTGWYAKWNRQRIAKTAHRGERSWRGDITGRKWMLNSRAAQAQRLDKRIVPYRKNRLNIGGAPPNRGQYTSILRNMKKQVRTINSFGGMIYKGTKRTESRGNNRYTAVKKPYRPNIKQQQERIYVNSFITRKPNRISQQTAAFAGNIPRPQLKQNPSSSPYARPTRKPNRISQQTAAFAGNIPRPQLKQNPSSSRYALPTRKQNRISQQTATFAGNIPRPQLKQNPSSSRYALPTRKQNRISQQTATFAGNIPRPQLKQNPSSSPYALPTRKQNRISQQTATFAGNIPRPQLKQNPSSSPYALPTRKQNRISQQTATFAGNIPRPQLKQNPSSSPYALPTRKQNRISQQTATFAGNIPRPQLKQNPSSNRYALPTRKPNWVTQQTSTFAGNMRMRKFNSPMLHPDAQFAHNFINNVQGERDLLTSLKLFWTKTFRKKDLQPPFLRGKSKKLRYDDRERTLWYR